MNSKAEHVAVFQGISSDHAARDSRSGLDWSDNEIHLPKFIYAVINLFQTAVPVIFPMILIYIFFILADFFHISYILKSLLFSPILILSYALYLYFSIKLSKWVVRKCNKKMPPAEGTFRRTFNEKNVEDTRLYFYHIRGFTYKWPVFTAKKTFLPWMVNYALREIGENQISKDTIYADTYVGLEFTNLKPTAALLYASSISSHVVDSIFGNLTIKSISIEDYGILQPHAIAGPGSVVGKETALFPFKVALKNEKCLEKFYVPYGHRNPWRGIEEEY